MPRKEANELFFTYDMNQARWMIRKLKGSFVYKIGSGGKGDPCVSFVRNEKVEKVIDEWEVYSQRYK
jgi:glycosylphosphatidylinositol transamidase (GPIT) subunit GPI8